MKNTMREGRDRELMVNIFTPPLTFTYSSSMQNREITSCKKKKRYMEKWGNWQKGGYAFRGLCMQSLQGREKDPDKPAWLYAHS